MDFDPDKAQVEIRRLEAMKEAVWKGELRGVRKELANDIVNEENVRENWRGELRKVFSDDEKYKALKTDILKSVLALEELEEVQAPLAKALIEEQIGNLRKERRESTRRGQIVFHMDETKERIGHLKGLQQVVTARSQSQPPTPANSRSS